MADVAAKAGVSRQLVSLVFRDQPNVADQSRSRILAAADELGYSPNIAARTLRSTSTRSIGVIFNTGEFAPFDIVEWLYTFAHAAGYTVIVSLVTASRGEREAIEELVGYRCEALILIAPGEDAAVLRTTAGKTPTVIIGRDLTEPSFSVVRSQGRTGIHGIVNHLAGLGHRNISFVHAIEMFDSESRLAGYQEAVTELGLSSDIVTVRDGFTEEAGALAASWLLERTDLPTAVVCNNDQAALGLSFHLIKAGFRIPDDVSVTGYDDSRLAKFSFLDLTTVRQDPEEVGGAAISTALDSIADRARASATVLTSAHLVVRGSTGQPRR